MNAFPSLVKLACHKRVTLALLLLLALLVCAPVLADTGDDITIMPSVNDLELEEGETITETVTVVVPAGASSSKVDVYLLADTTGSMSEPIGAVQAGASAIVDGLITDLPDVDLAFGAGDYKDFPWDAYAFRHQVSLTKATATVQAAIAAWAADGGNDGSEGQFFALDRLASDVDPAGDTIGWREGAERIIVWFGDAPGHDPVCAAISGLGFDITEGSVIAKLGAEGIGVVAISTLSGYPSGLDDDPTWGADDYLGFCTLDGTTGQATRIAAATGGTHMSGVDSNAIVDAIKNLVTAQVTTINRLSLRATGGTAPFVTSILPADYGPLRWCGALCRDRAGLHRHHRRGGRWLGRGAKARHHHGAGMRGTAILPVTFSITLSIALPAARASSRGLHRGHHQRWL